MIHHIDYLADDRQARVSPSWHGSHVPASGPATKRARQDEVWEEELEIMTGSRPLAAKCPCGKQYAWGGPVCGDCFAAAPERVQTDYLMGTLEGRQAASRWLAGLAMLRAAGLVIV